jgi:hypothetical protein
MAVNDVERLFRRLVEVLAARGEGRLLEPIDVADLYHKIIPYRQHRASLQFDTNQDYEMALLRLLAGEQGLVGVEPTDVAEALAQEVRSVNPDPGAFRAFANAKARLSYHAVKALLDGRAPYAPPEQAGADPPPVPVTHRARPVPFQLEPSATEPAATETCPQCSQRLPPGRTVNFCPHCGGSVKVRECPQCGVQLELEWRHCVACGFRVTG